MANARKHTTPDGTDATVSRATIFETFGNSIHDIVPVANTTERALLLTALAAEGLTPSPSNPVAVNRADAPGLHQVEITTDGTVWVPLSGILRFATKTAADSFGVSYPGLLSVGDYCFVGPIRYRWDGTAWRPRILGQVARSGTASTFGSTYTKASANVLWSPLSAEGIDDYDDGWTIPVSGYYQVSYEVRAAGSFLAGVSRNFVDGTTGDPGLFCATTAPTVQSIARATVSGLVSLTAGDVVRLHLLAASGDPAWATNTGFFAVEWVGD